MKSNLVSVEKGVYFLLPVGQQRYGSPFNMMKLFGVHYTAAGENIASGQRTPEAVVTAWMNSPGHRANILSTKYHKIGVGYAYKSSGSYHHYWTQWFTN